MVRTKQTHRTAQNTEQQDVTYNQNKLFIYFLFYFRFLKMINANVNFPCSTTKTYVDFFLHFGYTCLYDFV